MRQRSHSGQVFTSAANGLTRGGKHTAKRRLVVCPDCGAAVGEPCITATGKELRSCHRVRVRLSIRKMLDEQSTPVVD